mgnify:CR=1 FL=1|jgi:hypothetical protein|tara:strand:+ start:814 stop:1536 length:723 start_codon:yes stop_codon:yes gene_type:complete
MTNNTEILNKFFGETTQGKKCFFSEEQKQEMRQLKNKGLSNKELMQKYNIPRTSLSRYLDPQGVEKERQARLANPQWEKNSMIRNRKRYRSRTKEQKRQDVEKQYERTEDKERLHLRTLYTRMRRAVKRPQKNHSAVHNIHKEVPLISLEAFLTLWFEHKEERGMRCAYSNKIMTFTKGTYEKKVLTAVSVDRIDASKGYIEGNIVFCRWEFNTRKKDLTLDDVESIIKKLFERRRSRYV